jgi:hypothetical protein
VQCDFGAVSVGIPSEQVAAVKNVGDTPAVFWISSPSPFIKVAPERGCILGGACAWALTSLTPYRCVDVCNDVDGGASCGHLVL